MKKYPIPEAIENKMKLWRLGAIALPNEYVNFLKDAAEKEISTLLSLRPRHKVLHTYMADDGWFDGVEFLHVLLETPAGDVKKVKFSDSQYWYEMVQGGGGWTLIS